MAALLSGAATVAAMFVAVPPAAATTLTVTNLNDSGSGSLRAVLAAAPSGATVSFADGLSGTIELDSVIFLERDVSIEGNGNTLTIDAQHKDRIFVVPKVGEQVSISWLTLANGVANDSNDGGAPPEGGAINANYADLTLSHTTFVGNHADNAVGDAAGGAVFLSSPSVLNVRDSTFTNNYAGHDGGNQGGGGAIFSNGSATIADSTFSNNTAYGGGDEASGGGGLGGGVYIAPFTEPPVATITGSTFAHNSVTGGGTEGAGAALACSCARLINSTLTGNSASHGNGGGGGAYFALGGTLVADTIDGNTAGSDATAGVFEIEATSTFLNTIVAENTNGSGSANCGGFDIPGGKLADASSQYNLEDDPAHGCGFDLPAADPELAALATNGGPTQTQALRPGSPALDATPIAACVDDGGTSLTVDQRGYPRPDAGEDVCDIGAYEAQDPGVTITTPADGATYPYGAVIDADFSCAPGPGESGPLSCVGTVPSGAPIDTLTIGSRSFTVTASDSSGLTTSRTVHYTVDRAPTDTTLNVSETSPGVNQPVTFTATVTSSAAISVPPSGTVAFYVDAATDAAATVALSGNATASFTTSFGGGTHSVRAAYSGDDSYLPSSATANVGVSCNITITGRHAALVADKHATVCLSGATISGSLAVLSGATLDVENSIVSGAIVAQAPAAVRVCGSRIEATTVTHAVGPVFIGYPAQNCRANQISGALVANDNQGGLAIVDNVVTGTLVAVGNHPPVTIAGNHR